MNIKQAKNQIKDTLRAYLKRDDLGNYLIPPVRQRPILLMGPPGIGKTQIMEQIATEENVGLVAYTITHHTRQSAIGLPFIEKRIYSGTEYTVTEYTMSEIIGSVYRLMEDTGIREGILFLDEINCVSETLAPMMLQFLQCKTFGNQKLPEGWLIVAAGNPPEYNKSVRDFDVVTLDRVKKINVEEDFSVWKEYARAKGLHGAVISYLDIKKENFYAIETTEEGIQFATARGWEDLSEIITAYEKLDLRPDLSVVEQYIQLPRIARDFANYLSLYYKYNSSYHVDEILSGTWAPVTASEFAVAPFDEKYAVMGLLLTRLNEAAGAVRRQDALVSSLHGELKELLSSSTVEDMKSRMEEAVSFRTEQLKLSANAGQNDREKRILLQSEINALMNCLSAVSASSPADSEAAADLLRTTFATETEKLDALAEKAGSEFGNAFSFLEKSVGQSQEMVLFVTEITAGVNTSWYVGEFGCEAYFRHNKELLLSDTRSRILGDIAETTRRDS